MFCFITLTRSILYLVGVSKACSLCFSTRLSLTLGFSRSIYLQRCSLMIYLLPFARRGADEAFHNLKVSADPGNSLSP